MTTALGYSVGNFTPASPDRLCRGRERWITAPADRVGEELQRLVITAARFEDDNSKNAQRGLSCADIDLFSVFRLLFPDQEIVACAEDASAQAIPEGAVGIERFVMNRPFRPVHQWFSRWEKDCGSSADVVESIAAGATVFIVGPKPKRDDEPSVSFSDLPPEFDSEESPSRLREDLRKALFYLTGGRTGPQSFGLYQPTALFELLEHSEAIILLHRDKHAECLGIYVKAKESVDALVESFVAGAPSVTVPFSIPPMLARWDRAIWELKSKWNEAEVGPFPLPVALAESGAPLRSRHATDNRASRDDVNLAISQTPNTESDADQSEPQATKQDAVVEGNDPSDDTNVDADQSEPQATKQDAVVEGNDPSDDTKTDA